MKKTFKVLPVLLVCLLLLSACGSNSVPSSTDKGTNQIAENNPPKDWEPNPLEDFDYEYDEELQGVVLMYKGASEQAVFPSEFNGDPVVAVGVTRAPKTIYDMGKVRNSKVKEVYIPEGVQIIDAWAFRECAYLESITIPNSVTTIGTEAFYKCVRLTAIHLPENIEVIGSHVFAYCEQLVDITFESLNNLTHLGSSPFEGTYWQNRQPDGFITLGPNLLDYKGDAPSNLVIPDGIRLIAEGAFLYGGESIKTIKLPESLTNIGDAAFCSCESLTTINLPEGLTTIGENVFKECKSLTTINLPDGLTSIADNAFYRCDNLEDSTKERIRQINPDASF